MASSQERTYAMGRDQLATRTPVFAVRVRLFAVKLFYRYGPPIDTIVAALL